MESGDMYDEFGNYIGPELESDESEKEENEEDEEEVGALLIEFLLLASKILMCYSGRE